MDRAVVAVTVCMGKACVITRASSSDIFLANVCGDLPLAGARGRLPRSPESVEHITDPNEKALPK